MLLLLLLDASSSAGAASGAASGAGASAAGAASGAAAGVGDGRAAAASSRLSLLIASAAVPAAEFPCENDGAEFNPIGGEALQPPVKFGRAVPFANGLPETNENGLPVGAASVMGTPNLLRARSDANLRTHEVKMHAHFQKRV